MTDAVKMAIEALRPFAEAAGHIHPAHPDEATSLDGFPMSDFRRAAETIAALEQAGEPVDVALLDRAELAWQRFFYPAEDCFTGPVGDKLPSVDLEVADCLRLVLAAVGRLVVTPEADVPAPLTTLQRLGQEFDAGEEAETLAAMLFESVGDMTWHDPRAEMLIKDEWRQLAKRGLELLRKRFPPQSRVAAEPVGLREEESKLVTTARRNIRTFINAASFKSENDRQAAIACVDVLEEHMNGLGDLVTVLRSVFGAASSLATPSQPDPQSRGQAFDGDGEAAALAAELSGLDQLNIMLVDLIRRAMRLIPEGKSLWWDEAKAAIDLADAAAALSSAKRGEG